MRLTLLAKDAGRSPVSDCPSVYIADTGEFIVQGPELTGADRSALQNPLEGETAVRISPEVVAKAVEQYQKSSAK